MKKSSLLKLAVIMTLCLGGTLFAVKSAEAATWCGMLAPAYTASDCLAGQDYSTCTVVDRADNNCNNFKTSSSNALKTSFISNLEYYASQGQPFERVSANWIEQQIGSNWTARVNNPNVTASVYAYSYTINRAYDPSTNSIVSYSESGTELSLVFKYNGVPYFAIKLDCGNPVGTLKNIPLPVNIQGTVYYYNSGGSNALLPGVAVSSRGAGADTTTNASGKFEMTMDQGTGFGVQVPSSFTYSGNVYTKPVISPGYILSGALPGGSPPAGVNLSCGGVTSYYWQQVANTPNSSGACDYGIGDSGYNIAYTVCTNNGKACGAIITPSPCTLPASYPETVSLPNAPLPPGTTSGAPYSSSYPGSVVFVATPQDSYDITSAHDQYPNPTNVSWSPGGYSSNPFSLDYINYIEQYPYDDHATTINYTQKYSVQAYESLTPQYTYSCSPNYGSPPSCLYTGFPVGCNIITDVNCYFQYGTLITNTYYLYVPIGGAYTEYSNGTTSGPAFNEWCPRNFEVLPPTLTDVNSVSLTANGNTPDQPNQATVSTQTTVKFTLNYWSQLVRNPLSVNGINYSGSYYIEHASGGADPIDSPDNKSFDIVGSTVPGNVTYPYNASFAVGVPQLQVGDQVCAQFSDSPESGEVDESGTITNVDSFGPVYSSQIPSNATCSNPVANYPYSRSYGNDVIAGTDFSNAAVNQCDLTAAIIASVTPDSQARPRGSGTQFAALSLGQIQYYASAFLRSASATAINGLSQANTSGGYGGNYNGGCQSIYNYYLNSAQSSPTAVNVNYGQTYNVSSNTNSVELNFINSNNNNYVVLQAGSGATSITGEHVIYVAGNVYIPS
ncbi:MAG: hypothetical protein ACREF7_04585, partial [Candidatus Saccharimonadales bacterium]